MNSPENAGETLRVRPILETLLRREALSAEDAAAFMRAVMSGSLPPASMAAVAVALSMKGETVGELAAMAAAMRAASVKIVASPGALDTCGTGGDASGTFNISTAAALVIAAAGVPVAKHGGRSVSSTTGSADVLLALGVNVDAAPEHVQRCLNEVGIAFLFAPTFHPGMRHAAGVRKELGIRTVFNLLGPLSNPAGAKLQLLGVNRPELCETFARVLQTLGSTAALVVCGSGGAGGGHLDEVSTFGPTTVARLQDGVIKVVQLDAEKFGIPRAEPAALRAESAAASAEIIQRILKGERGPARDIVVVNAAAALQIAGKAGTWHDGLRLAEAAIDSGKAGETLVNLARFTVLS